MALEETTPALVLDFRDNLDAEAVSLAGLGERGRRTGPALAEMKVPADDDRADPEPGDRESWR